MAPWTPPGYPVAEAAGYDCACGECGAREAAASLPPDPARLAAARPVARDEHQ